MKNSFPKVNLELAAWASGLIFLLIFNPSKDIHFSLCLFNLAGIEFCPGCGLGKSISHLLHFNLKESFNIHPLGIPAFLILFHRIFSLALKDVRHFQSSGNSSFFLKS